MTARINGEDVIFMSAEQCTATCTGCQRQLADPDDAVYCELCEDKAIRRCWLCRKLFHRDLLGSSIFACCAEHAAPESGYVNVQVSMYGNGATDPSAVSTFPMWVPDLYPERVTETFLTRQSLSAFVKLDAPVDNWTHPFTSLVKAMTPYKDAVAAGDSVHSFLGKLIPNELSQGIFSKDLPLFNLLETPFEYSDTTIGCFRDPTSTLMAVYRLSDFGLELSRQRNRDSYPTTLTPGTYMTSELMDYSGFVNNQFLELNLLSQHEIQKRKAKKEGEREEEEQEEGGEDDDAPQRRGRGRRNGKRTPAQQKKRTRSAAKKDGSDDDFVDQGDGSEDAQEQQQAPVVMDAVDAVVVDDEEQQQQPEEDSAEPMEEGDEEEEEEEGDDFLPSQQQADDEEPVTVVAVARKTKKAKKAAPPAKITSAATEKKAKIAEEQQKMREWFAGENIECEGKTGLPIGKQSRFVPIQAPTDEDPNRYVFFVPGAYEFGYTTFKQYKEACSPYWEQKGRDCCYLIIANKSEKEMAFIVKLYVVICARSSGVNLRKAIISLLSRSITGNAGDFRLEDYDFLKDDDEYTHLLEMRSELAIVSPEGEEEPEPMEEEEEEPKESAVVLHPNFHAVVAEEFALSTPPPPLFPGVANSLPTHHEFDQWGVDRGTTEPEQEPIGSLSPFTLETLVESPSKRPRTAGGARRTLSMEA